MTPAAIRGELGITVEEAAEAAGIAKNSLSLWESDPERSTPAIRAACETLYKRLRPALEAVRKALGVRV